MSNLKRLYLENVRSFFNCSSQEAQAICDAAVECGAYEYRVGVVCPNDGCGRVIVSAYMIHDIPTPIVCDVCELAERDEFEFGLCDLKRVYFCEQVKPEREYLTPAEAADLKAGMEDIKAGRTSVLDLSEFMDEGA